MLSDRTKWRVPDGVVVPGRGWLLFWADGQEEQGDRHTNFTLSRNGDQIGIYRSEEFDNAAVDTVTFGLQQADVSYGRVGDGRKEFVFFKEPTPGESNASCPEDLDGDGRVGFGDLVALLAAWGACPKEGECPEDLDGNGVVEFSDLLALLAVWGQCG